MTFTTRTVRPKDPVDRLGASRRSSTRVQKTAEGVQMRRNQTDAHYAGHLRTPEETEARRNEKRTSQSRYTLGLGALAAMGLVAVGLSASRGRHDAPVDVDKLPANQVTRVAVGPDSSHSASGIAGDIMNNKTDINQVTTEIEQEVGSETVPTGTELKLPTDQIDPAAVEKFEPGK